MRESSETLTFSRTPSNIEVEKTVYLNICDESLAFVRLKMQLFMKDFGALMSFRVEHQNIPHTLCPLLPFLQYCGHTVDSINSVLATCPLFRLTSSLQKSAFTRGKTLFLP